MKTLNIFTDASIVNTDGPYETVGCAGFVSATGEFGDTKLQTLDESYTLITNTTNNFSEALAIMMAVNYASYKQTENNYDEINIFSDSQWCIRSLTTWIFNWISTVDEKGIMYSSSEEPVKNQDIISSIIIGVVFNHLKVRFWHCKGHVKDTNASLFDALKVFRQSNHIKRDIHLNYNSIYIMSYYNNLVDNTSREICKEFCNTGNSNHTIISRIGYGSFMYMLDKNMLEQYKNLIS